MKQVAITTTLLARLGWPVLLCGVLGAAQVQATTTTPPLSLTPAEQAYVQQHRTVWMCVDPDWAPFERLNEQGQHVGIAADLMALVAQRTGLNIQPLAVRSWEESLAASRAGRCQIMSFLNQTPERETWLRFTEPVFSDPNVLITREEHPYIADLQALSRSTVALPRGTMVEERIRTDFSQLQIVTTASEQDAVEMVSERKADMTIRSLIVAAYTIKQQGLFNLKISGQVPKYTNQLRIGVLKSDLVLWSVLNKAVQTITAQEKESIANRHVAIQVQQGVDHKRVWQVLAVATGLLLVGGFWHRKLRQIDQERATLAEARVEQTLQTQRNQSQLMALLSHEVRTSLSIIDGAAGSLRLLLEPDNAACLLRVERIHTGVQRIQELTDQFLTKDRLESGALTPQRVHTDGLTLCHETVHLLDEQHRVRIQHQGDTCLCADPDLLQVALRNLLVNALRYTPPGSPVTVNVVEQDDHVVFRVTDEGPGIPAAEQDMVFFSYVRGSQSHGKPGSGLGLHLVRRVAELHSGTVSLDSPAAGGASFALSLPRA